MPSAQDHQRQAERHFAFMETIDGDEYCDWLSVAAFYVAVHLVERLRALTGGHSDDHKDRGEYVKDDHPTIHHPYRQLYSWARNARYEVNSFHWLTPERVRATLEEIRRYADGFPDNE
jgi:hypothetical protein